MSVADKITALDGILSGCVDGKAAIAQAITAKGVPTADDDSFDMMAVNVGLIAGVGGLEKTYVGTVPNRGGALNQASSDIGSFSVDSLDFDAIIFLAQDNSSVKINPFNKEITAIPGYSIYYSKFYSPQQYAVAGYGIANRTSVDQKDFTVTYSRMTGTSAAFLSGGVPFDIYTAKLSDLFLG